MGQLCTFDQLAGQLRQAQSIILLTHNDPDGDALGSQLTLARALKTLGKETKILNVGVLSELYAWMVEENEVEFIPKSGPFPEKLEADLLIGLDFNGWERLLGLEKVVRESGIPTAVIDHHPNCSPSANYTFVDVGACCTGILVWRFIKELGVVTNLTMAVPCYVTLITDTGHFRFSNTDVRAHELAVELLNLGVNPVEVYQYVYETSSPNRLKLLGKVLGGIKLIANNQVAYGVVTEQDYKDFSVSPDETEGFIDHVRTVKGVDVSVFMRPSETGQIKVSMRSRGFDISKFAARFDGGGHCQAAGMIFDCSIEEVVDTVVKALEEEFALLENGA